MSSNLVPVHLPDKNGKVVTRWVRPVADSSSGSSLPQVTVKPQVDVRERLAKLFDSEVEEHYSDVKIDPVPELLKHADKRLSDSTLISYLHAIEEYPDKYITSLLLSVLNRRCTDEKAQYILEITKENNLADYVWNNTVAGTFAYNDANKAWKGLRVYEEIGFTPPQDLTDDSDKRVQQTKALIKVTMGLWEEKIIEESYSAPELGIVVCLPEDRLVELILEQPEKADEILSTAIQANTARGSRIAEMMNTPSVSLRGGVL